MILRPETHVAVPILTDWSDIPRPKNYDHGWCITDLLSYAFANGLEETKNLHIAGDFVLMEIRPNPNYATELRAWQQRRVEKMRAELAEEEQRLAEMEE